MLATAPVTSAHGPVLLEPVQKAILLATSLACVGGINTIFVMPFFLHKMVSLV